MFKTSSGGGKSYQTLVSKIHGKRFYSWLSFLLLTLGITPTEATAKKLGVVRSQDNARGWSEIAERLQATGIDYCVVEAANWQDSADLKEIDALLIPNVSNLSANQANALEQWMSKGGKAVVTGPTGSLSQPEVRSQLRSLFGAYWGFPITAPSTLQPAANGLNKPELSANFKGGVVLPSSLNSQTAAVWLADGKPPAVVTTDKSTFLGWRWGINNITSPAFDAAWLQSTLDRYGDFATASEDSGLETCNGAIAANPPAQVPQGINPAESSQPEPTQPRRRIESRVLVPEPNDRGRVIDSVEALEMTQELEGLIARFESTLLSAEASNSDFVPTATAVENFLDKQNTKNRRTQSRRFSSRGQTVALNAREKLANFRELVKQQKYAQAEQQWTEARRLLWDNYPTDRQLAQPEIRAMWLDRKTIVEAKSESELAKLFDRLAAAGINTVFFETVNASYPIYPSKVAPQQNPLTRGWDPLKAAVKLAHDRDMELHAWVWVFAGANQRHNTILGQPANSLGPVLSKHPDWAITDRQGRAFQQSSRKAFFDPANPEVKRYLLQLFDEIATQYEVDGIHLDYIRYPFQNPRTNYTYGYSKVSRQTFKQMTGVDPITLSPRHPLWSRWQEFRIEQIDSFVASASQQLKEKRPELILSTAVFPLPRAERLATLQQNWEEWASQHWIDWVVPMTYASSTDDLQQLTLPLFGRSGANSTLFLPGIRLLNLPEAIAFDQMQLLRNLPTGGYALFAAENFSPNLQTIFSRTQTQTSSQPLPHRQPFGASAARYQALQREWNFLLSQEQLIMEEAAMKEWGKQADRLATALNKLSQEPSTRDLLSAQLALSTFRRSFPRWMRQYAQVQPYQVEVWENRLETLERLIGYGERTVINQESTRVAEDSR